VWPARLVPCRRQNSAVRRAVLLLSCALLAACGSSGSHRLTREEYARRADAICARYQHLTTALGTPSTTRQLAVVAGRTLRILDKATSELVRLRPPESEEPLARQWLDSIAVLRRDVVRLRDRASANDLLGVRRVVRPATRDNRASDRLAARLGMTVCSRG
jgi:hypothetical protein